MDVSLTLRMSHLVFVDFWQSEINCKMYKGQEWETNTPSSNLFLFASWNANYLIIVIMTWGESDQCSRSSRCAYLHQAQNMVKILPWVVGDYSISWTKNKQTKNKTAFYKKEEKKKKKVKQVALACGAPVLWILSPPPPPSLDPLHLPLLLTWTDIHSALSLGWKTITAISWLFVSFTACVCTKKQWGWRWGPGE